MKIFNKLLILVLILSIVPILVLSYINTGITEEHFLSSSYVTLNILADAKESHLLEYTNTLKARIDDFSTDNSIQQHVKLLIEQPSNRTLAESLNGHLRYKISLDKQITHLGIAGMDGRVLADTDDDEVGLDFSNLEYVKNAKTYARYTPSYFPEELKNETVNSRLQITVYKIITDMNTEEQLGILFFSIDLQDISDVLSGERMEKSKNSAINGETNSLEMAIRKEIDIYLVNGESLLITNSRHSSRILAEKINTLPVAKCVNEGKAYAGRYTSFANTTVLGASRCISPHSWTLIAETPEEKVIGLINRTNYTTIMLGLLAIIFSIVFGSLFYYFIVHINLQKLTEYIDDLTAGNIDAKHEIKSGDEFEDLANHFDNMSKVLSQHIKSEITEVKIQKKK